ncbi:hypothetical protein LCGC14_1683020 [marine sediment metagenome]|uniref:Uncharacterized protein n=1 Tax=marine sediment metagenome TaxID=412755 RepID=A0A0F9HN60_9ZZZZ
MTDTRPLSEEKFCLEIRGVHSRIDKVRVEVAAVNERTHANAQALARIEGYNAGTRDTKASWRVNGRARQATWYGAGTSLLGAVVWIAYQAFK